MIFTEPRFVLMMLLAWATFASVPHRHRSALLAGWGTVFYLVFAPEWTWLIGLVIVLAWVVQGSALSWAFVALLAGMLAYFKVGADFVSSFFALERLDSLTRTIPLGLSFVTFELIHLLVERRRGRITAAPLVDVAAFALFFPCRVAGPIRRFPDFTKAIAEARPSAESVYRGVARILIGLLKKFAIADVLAETVFEIKYPVTGPVKAWTIVLAFSWQLYLDFSAYSDIAIGLAQTMGITVPENFNWPYLAANIRDFWTRWHMTLSFWVRDYVFTPIGRRLFATRLRAHPHVIAASGYFVSFAIIGLWHGVTAAFLAWGVYHGALVTAYHVFTAYLPVRVATSAWYNSRPVAWVGVLATYLAVSVGWVFFLADYPKAIHLIAIMFGVAR